MELIIRQVLGKAEGRVVGIVGAGEGLGYLLFLGGLREGGRFSRSLSLGWVYYCTRQG